MDIVNSFCTVRDIHHPYRIWVIDDFLNPEVAERIYADWPNQDSPSWHGNYTHVAGERNILEDGMRAISKPEKMPPYIDQIVQRMHSPSFTEQLGTLLGVAGLVPDEHMRWSGLRVMLPNSYQLIHSDARKSPESGLRKELTCLLYFNKAYSRRSDEGCLEIWDDAMKECVHTIEPLFNRMTVFVNSDTSYHGVPSVHSERRAITFSILAQGTGSERSKALFVPRPIDGEDVRKQGIQRALHTP
jgi:Rps23 Pro-64 3,4-dihydroxylase Tpa1-like proline 4-hydroxylase